MNLILQLRSSSQEHDIQLDDVDVIQFDRDVLTVHYKTAQTWQDLLVQHIGSWGIYFTELGEQIEYTEFCLVEQD